MTYVRMADAAYAANIPPGFEIAAGYYPGRDDYHPWSRADWGLFPGDKLPITVPDVTRDGTADGAAALAYLRSLGVPEGSFTSVDLEALVAVPYLLAFGVEVQQGFRLWTYGSASTVFKNPGFNGYWVADYGLTTKAVDQLLQHEHVRAVQAYPGPAYDVSLVKQWTEGGMWHG